ncbi:hypothetical protein DAPPUDRAFT_97498 [Daphnia pulex]|uniref:Uncharacterized protein n=1 Tax=Daphnia pulex TaxID=6669 RepID=E9G1I1_DAPPU|nr:hypothetical protein DAPPUDRAFT_97498 [Daphnia pulex]|eukprot:EFX86503.1 hypothetical protein DAPPUDRAFT_97498 [Daphnia pulex]
MDGPLRRVIDALALSFLSALLRSHKRWPEPLRSWWPAYIANTHTHTEEKEEEDMRALLCCVASLRGTRKSCQSTRPAFSITSERRGGFHQWGNDDDDDDDVEWRNRLWGSCRFCRRTSQVRQQDKQQFAWPVGRDDDDVFGRGLVSFHTPPVSRLLFCGPLPYSVSRERMNGDEFGQHKEEEYFLSFLLMARKTAGYCRTGERTSFCLRLCVYLGLVCLLLFLFLGLCAVIHDAHRSKLRALCSGGV